MQNEHSAAPAQPEASMLAAEAVPASSSMVGHRSGRSAWSEELVKVGLSVEHCRVAKAAKASPAYRFNISGRPPSFGYPTGVPRGPLDVK